MVPDVIAHLVACESQGRSVKHLDSNHRFSYGVGQIQAGTWSEWSQESGITGDPMNISRLFQNLIANALKFRSKDRPCVVTVRAVESEREWIFSVADTGIGIRSEDFDRIFRIFQRLHGVGEYTGNGIGLAACKKIVERHHGRIWVESQLGVGTTFLFSVPKEAAGITGKPT